MWMGEPGVLVGDLGSNLAGQGELSIEHGNISTSNGISSCGTVYTICCSPSLGMNDGLPVSSPLQMNNVQNLTLSSQNMQNGQIGLNHSPYTLETLHSQTICHREPYLNILIQPTNRIRYRYRSEKGSHGGLTGKTCNTTRKTYPTVRLENYRGNRQVCIRGSLYTNEQHSKPHVHKLMGRNCNEDGICTIHLGEDMTAVFQNLGILFAAKKEVPQILYQRKLEELSLLKDFVIRNAQCPLTESEKQHLREEADKEAKDMNLNSVKICFEALAYNPDTDLYENICPPIFSDAVANQKSPDFGELKISRIDKCSGVCTGDEEVFLLCEKVNKKEIKIRFFEIDENGKVMWESYGRFNETDVHHQVAIVFRTPAYHNTEIKNAVKVYLQLFRSKDGECSEAKEFHYKPVDHHKDGVEQKRKKPNFNPGFGGFGYNTNQYDPGSYNTGPTDMGNGGDEGLQGFFGKSPSGYQRKANFIEEDSDNSEMVQEMDKLAEFSQDIKNVSSHHENLLKKDVLKKLISSSSKDFDLLKEDILKKTNELQTFINKSLKEVMHRQEKLRHSSDISQNEIHHSLSIFQTNISKVIEDFSSYLMVKLGRFEVNSLSPIDPKLIQILCEKKIQEEVTNISRILAKEEAENLQYFSATGDIRELLIDKHHLLAVGNDAGDTPLHLVILHQPENIYLIHLFLDILSDMHNPINQLNNLHQTCLHLAVQLNPKLIPDLLKHGADPNIQDRFGNTSIHLAIETNNVESLSHLLCINNYCNNENKYPRLSTLNYCGQSALHLAVIKGNELCTRLLCQAGGDVNQQEGTRGRSSLHLAIEYNPQILDVLVKQKNTDFDLQDYAGNTALHLACSRKLKESIMKLIKEGSNPNILNNITCGSFDDDDDDEMDESDDDNYGDEDENFGQTAFDLIDGDKEIIDILNGLAVMESMDISEQHSTQSEISNTHRKTDDRICENDGDLNKKDEEIHCTVDSGFCSSEITLFDDEILNKLCELLDPPNKDWEKLALFLGVDNDISFEKEVSPTRTIIKHFQRDGDIDIFINAIEAAQLTEVKEVIRHLQE